MGCDIHMLPEVLTDDGWGYVGPEPIEVVYSRFPWAAPGAKPENHPGFDLDQFRRSYIDEPNADWSPGRNYALFAILAGVRNYVPVEPLFANRGAPDDVSAEVRNYLDRWGIDLHSHTFATLRELHDEQIGTADPGPAWTTILGLLAAAAPDGDLDRVRVVIAFDN